VPQHIWTQYLKSGCHSRISRLIEQDLRNLSSYFREVRARTIKCLETCKEEPILSVFKSNFLKEDGQLNEEAFRTIVQFLIENMAKEGMKVGNLKTKLLITENPWKYLDQSLDFGLFYEREDEELEVLKERFVELRV
jgi:(2Fe-2S) ferredoxin